MKPLRLLVVSEPGMDGVFVIVESVIRQIHRRHPEIVVDLAYSSKRAGDSLWTLVREVEDHGGEAMDLRVGNAPSPADASALWRLAAFSRRRKHHVIHANSSKAGALTRLARMLGAVPPVIYTPHAYYGMPRLGTPKEKFFNLIEAVLGRIGLSITCSEDERDFARDVLRIPSRLLRVIHNGIDTARFCPGDPLEKAAARETLGLPSQGKILATIGRRSAQKNYEPLYAALNTLLPVGDWSFAHAGAGSGALRAEMSPAAAARCHSFEHLADVVPLLKAADGFVMTSRYEGLSLAMLSGMSAALPMFLTEAPGFLFLKECGFEEITWIPNSPTLEPCRAALETALTAWAKTPPQLMTAQRNLVCRLFNEQHQIEKVIALFREIGGGRGMGR